MNRPQAGGRSAEVPHRTMFLRHRRGFLAVSVVVGLVVAASYGLLTARVTVASPVVDASQGYLNESAVYPYNFTIREFYDVPKDTKISVSFLNADTYGIAHTFTILNWSNRTIPASESTGFIGSIIHHFGALINLTNANETKYVYGNFTSPGVGFYEFVCLESGHFSYGMYGYIAFGEALPANLSLGSGLPGPGLAVFIIVGTIVTLTVLAIVLGFVFGQRKGAEHEMPPERLGYPEPPTSEPLPSMPPAHPPT